MSQRVVIIGAGPAGMRCAEQLALAGADVCLISDEAALPYDRVALSKWLARDMEDHELITHDATRLGELGIAWRSGTAVTRIDRDARRLHCADGAAIGYDTLVIATGSSGFRLPMPGATLPGVLLYRTREDVSAMIAAAESGGCAVVIGGGLLGLEAAAGLAARGMSVCVLHAVDRLMERQLDHRAAARLAAHLRRQGIDVIENAASTAILGDSHVTGVALKDGRVIAAELVVMAVGIRPQTALAREAGLTVNRGIVVDAQMRTADPTIFAIGECAEFDGQCIGLVVPAFAQAEVAARVIAGDDAAFAHASDAAALKVAGAPVWSAGLVDSDSAETIMVDDPTGLYRRFLVQEDRLVGALLYGDTGDSGWYMRMIREQLPIGALRAALPFGPAFADITA